MTSVTKSGPETQYSLEEDFNLVANRVMLVTPARFFLHLYMFRLFVSQQLHRDFLCSVHRRTRLPQNGSRTKACDSGLNVHIFV